MIAQIHDFGQAFGLGCACGVVRLAAPRTRSAAPRGGLACDRFVAVAGLRLAVTLPVRSWLPGIGGFVFRRLAACDLVAVAVTVGAPSRLIRMGRGFPPPAPPALARAAALVVLVLALGIRGGLRRGIKATQIPVIALGGVDPTLAAACIQAGAAGVAAITAVFGPERSELAALIAATHAPSSVG